MMFQINTMMCGELASPGVRYSRVQQNISPDYNFPSGRLPPRQFSSHRLIQLALSAHRRHPVHSIPVSRLEHSGANVLWTGVLVDYFLNGARPCLEEKKIFAKNPQVKGSACPHTSQPLAWLVFFCLVASCYV